MTDSVTDLEARFGSAWHVNSIAICTALGYITGTGSPVGVVTPAYVGQPYYDTAGMNFWQATGTANTNWSVDVPGSGTAGFFGTTPITQPAAITPPTLTPATATSPFGYATQAQAQAVLTSINSIVTALTNLGLIA